MFQIVDRSAVDANPRQGPLIIEEFDATISVPPDATVHQGCDRLHRSGVRGMKVDPITFAVIKSGPRFDRRRHGLYGGADRAFRDRQGT